MHHRYIFMLFLAATCCVRRPERQQFFPNIYTYQGAIIAPIIPLPNDGKADMLEPSRMGTDG